MLTPTTVPNSAPPTYTPPALPPTPPAEEAVTWDVLIDVPPPRPSVTVTAAFVAGGRRPPRIPDDPQD